MKIQFKIGLVLAIMLVLFVTIFWGCKKEELATLSTIAASEITSSSAKSGGNITNDGGGEISSRGLVWATHDNPSVEQHLGITEDGKGAGLFTSNISNLSPGTSYFVRAYAINGTGTAYGNQEYFTASSLLPTLTTSNAVEITKNSAKVGGDVTDDGGGLVTARGVVYSTSQNPTNIDNLVSAGSGTGSFTADLSDLNQGTTYYARSFATNSAGTAYGNQVAFSTMNPPVASFTGTPTSGTAPLTVSFTDQSTNNPISWIWNFGDGATSTQNNPSHTYGKPGIYTVQLIVTNDNGLDSISKTNYIEVTIESGIFTDTRDGQSYKWVRIGDQVWMAENLKYLPEVIGSVSDAYLDTMPRYYVYGYPGKDVIAAKATASFQNYGVLYNWRAVMNGASSSNANPSGVQGVCPSGWHVPSDAEWMQLVNYAVSQGYPDLNVVNGAGNALKSCRQVFSPLSGACNTNTPPRWDPHSTNFGTDAFGFSALPGGRTNSAVFYEIDRSGYWSTATSKTWAINHEYGWVANPSMLRYEGFSLRCVRD